MDQFSGGRSTNLVYYFDPRKGIVLMKKRYSGPQIVAKLRQADVLIGQGKFLDVICPYLFASWPAQLDSWAHSVLISRCDGPACQWQ